MGKPEGPLVNVYVVVISRLTDIMLLGNSMLVRWGRRWGCVATNRCIMLIKKWHNVIHSSVIASPTIPSLICCGTYTPGCWCYQKCLMFDMTSDIFFSMLSKSHTLDFLMLLAWSHWGGLMTHICVCKLSYRWFRYWLVTWSLQSHYVIYNCKKISAISTETKVPDAPFITYTL